MPYPESSHLAVHFELHAMLEACCGIVIPGRVTVLTPASSGKLCGSNFKNHESKLKVCDL